MQTNTSLSRSKPTRSVQRNHLFDQYPMSWIHPLVGHPVDRYQRPRVTLRTINLSYSTIITNPLATETPNIETWPHSQVLLFEAWCCHNVKQMALRDSWDITFSTFNDEILQTIHPGHLEDRNHFVVIVKKFPINHKQMLTKKDLAS